MYRWPWPDSEVAWVVARARRALDRPRVDELIDAFLIHLATADFGDGPVRQLAAWVKRFSLNDLRREVESIEDKRLRALAEMEAGMPRRRGDIVRIRSKKSWWDVRTK